MTDKEVINKADKAFADLYKFIWEQHPEVKELNEYIEDLATKTGEPTFILPPEGSRMITPKEEKEIEDEVMKEEPILNINRMNRLKDYIYKIGDETVPIEQYKKVVREANDKQEEIWELMQISEDREEERRKLKDRILELEAMLGFNKW